MELNGKVIADKIKQNLIGKCDNLTLAIITSKDSGSISYLKSRVKLCETLNIKTYIYYQEDIKNEDDFLNLINKLNNDEAITGLMIDRPLDKRFNENIILNSIDYRKDIDGLTVYNSGLLMQNKNCLTPLTPTSVMLLLDQYDIDVCGKNVCVIGRSQNVGMPLAKMLMNKNATVTVCHSKTINLRDITQRSEIIIACLGKKEFIDESYINKNTTIIDVGIHYDLDGKIVGDVSNKVYDKVKNYSPVPRGVGPLTSVMLVLNLLKIKKGDDKVWNG